MGQYRGIRRTGHYKRIRHLLISENSDNLGQGYGVIRAKSNLYRETDNT